MLKISLVTDKIYPFYVGGYERRYWEIAKRIATKHDVHIFTSCPRSITYKNVHFHKIAPYMTYVDDKGYRIIGKDILYSLMLFKKSFEKMDYIDCNATPFTYIPVSVFLSKLNNAKSSVTVHEALLGSLQDYFSEVVDRKNQLLKPLVMSNLPLRYIHWALNIPDHVIAVSNITANVLKESFNIKNPITVPNGIDPSITNLIKTPINKGTTVTYLGRLSPEKCVDDLISAVHHLKRNGNSDILCNIIGDGPDHRRLEKLTNGNGDKDNIVFHGYVSDDRKYDLLSETDVFVLPSKREGFSISTMEALGCGLPVIAAKPTHLESSGVFEYLIEGHNGLSYPVNNPLELSKKISYLLNDPLIRRKLSHNALNTSKNYSWDIIVDQYLGFIEGMY